MLVAAVTLAACGSPASSAPAAVESSLAGDTAVETADGDDDLGDGTSAASSPVNVDVDAAQQGTAAASERVRFQPAEVELSDGSTAPVQPAPTVNGELVVPENVDHLGWWDGGAYVNDPFGSTVIAGHIDSAEQGVGYFGRLLNMKVDDVVTVRGDEGELAYRVTSTELIDKDVLVSGSLAFDQRGEHRLVLITCSGRWRPEVRSYESNFVVIAEPIGLAE